MQASKKKHSHHDDSSQEEQEEEGNKDNIKDDIPAAAVDDIAPDVEQKEQYIAAEEYAVRRKEVTQKLQKILDSLSQQKDWPDSVLAALHSPELHELFAQHVVLLRDEAKVLEGLEECHSSESAAYDSYLDAVRLTSMAERALMDHTALKRRVRCSNYAHPPPKEGRELSAEAAAFLSKHRSTQSEMEVQLAAKLEASRLHLDATKRHVSSYLAQKKELEKAKSK